jgi:hypothetical protein
MSAINKFHNIIQRTFNGGVTWSPILLNKSFNQMVFINETGYLINGNTLYKSTNYGITWTNMNLNGYTLNNISMLTNNYVMITATNYLLVSLNGFSTFTAYNLNGINYIYVYSTTFVICVTSNIIYSFNGSSFTSLFTFSYNITNIIIVNSNIIIVSILGYLYYISYNTGASWSTYNLPTIFNKLFLYNNSVYALTFDNNLYKIELYRPYNVNIYCIKMYRNISDHHNLQ